MKSYRHPDAAGPKESSTALHLDSRRLDLRSGVDMMDNSEPVKKWGPWGLSGKWMWMCG